MTGLIAVASSGAPAILTAIGGVCVSIFTVYKNAKRQDKATQENTDHINDLVEQTKQLTNQVIELKAQNAAQATEIAFLRGAQVQTQAAVVENLASQVRINDEAAKPKKKKK